MRRALRRTAPLFVFLLLTFLAENLLAQVHAHQSCVVYPEKESRHTKALQSKSYMGLAQPRGSVQPIQTDITYGTSQTRQLIAQTFYSGNADVYDFLYVFSDFDFVMPPNANGVYSGVRNSIRGINVPQFDVGSDFGSERQLQGYIDMDWMGRLEFNRTKPRYTAMLNVAMHEFMHRYGPNLRYLDGNGQTKHDLINSTNVMHWSYALDTDASVMYGARWSVQPDNSFRATQLMTRLSPLDMYVAGWSLPSAVPAIKLLQINPLPTANIPEIGTIASVGTTTITMGQILAVEGAREPAYPNAQRKFRAAIILLTRPGVQPDQARFDELEMFRTHFEDYFSAMTGGQASISFEREGTILPTDAPISLLPRDIPPPSGGGGLDGAVNILSYRGVTPPIADRPGTAVRDTAAYCLAMRAAFPQSPYLSNAVNWLSQAPITSGDDAAAVLSVLPSHAGALAALRGMQSGNRFALTGQHAVTQFDSALALSALANVSGQSGLTQLRSELGNAAIGYTESGQARLVPTIQAAAEIAREPSLAAQLPPLVSFIRSRMQVDGSFLEGGVRDVLAAALVLQYGTELGFRNVELDAIEAQLLTQQDSSSLFFNSAYLTAQAILGLERNNRPDLVLLGAPEVRAGANYAGEAVPVRFVVKNQGKRASTPSKATLVRRQANGTEVPLGINVDIPALPPGGTSLPITIVFDSSGAVGTNDLTLVLDSEQQVAEFYETNNRANISVQVVERPQSVELSLGELNVSPNYIRSLPQTVTINTSVTNVGLTNAAAALVGLYRTNGTSLELISEQSRTLNAGASSAVNFSFELTSGSSRDYSVIIDRANVIAEENENNNRRDFMLTVEDVADIRITQQNIQLSPSAPTYRAKLGGRIIVENTGTVDLPILPLDMYFKSGEQRSLVNSSVVGPISAGETFEFSVSAQVLFEGEVEVEFVVDRSNQIAEANENNNSASKTIFVGSQQVEGLTEWDDLFLGDNGSDLVDALGGDDKLEGRGGDDVLRGGPGRDSLECTGLGNCRLEGGEHADHLVSNSSQSTLHGGLGDDRIFVQAGHGAIEYALGDGADEIHIETNESAVLILGAGLSPQNVVRSRIARDLYFKMPDGGSIHYVEAINGTPKNFRVQFLNGTSWDSEFLESNTAPIFSAGPDVLFGTAGADNYSALDGKDFLYGGAGNDVLNGNAGNDQLFGEDGNDTLSGHSSDDRLVGGEGDDQLLGGDGNDLLVDEIGSNLLDGGTGNDQLLGGGEVDRLYGGSGRDSLQGGDGADELTGGVGRDSLQGGAGLDRYSYAAGDDGTDTIRDSGSNTLVLSVDPALVALVKVESELFITFPQRPSDQIRATGIDRIEFSSGAIWNATEITSRVTIQPGSVNTLLDTDADDVLSRDHSADQLAGPGGGIDTLSSSVDLRYEFGIENLKLLGNLALNVEDISTHYVVEGNSSNNIFRKPDSEFQPQAIVKGGAGDDLYDHVLPYELAGEGDDEATWKPFEYALVRNWAPRTRLDRGPALIERYTLNQSCNSRSHPAFGVISDMCEVVGTDGNDIIDASLSSQSILPFTLNGGLGADLLIGSSAVDAFVVDNSADQVIDDGSGAKVIYSSADYTLPESVPELSLFGTQPIKATGNSRNNILRGVLNTASNVLSGGSGDDSYALGAGDTIEELADAGSDWYIDVRSDFAIAPSISVENIELAEGGAWNATGDSRANKLTGNTSSNVLSGGAGNDQLVGGLGNDRLFGGGGDDELNAEDDYAHGGTGNDLIDSAAFVDFERGDGQDVIKRSAWIRLRGYAETELARRRDDKDLVLENLANGDRITLVDFFRGTCATTVEFSDGVIRRCSDYGDLIPVFNFSVDDIDAAAGSPAVFRAKVNLGQYGEKVRYISFHDVSGPNPTVVDTTAPYEYPVTGTDEVQISAEAFLVDGGRILSRNGNPRAYFRATPAPLLELQAPASGNRALRNAPFLLQAHARAVGNRSIAKVEFLVDGLIVSQDSSAPYEHNLMVGSASSYTISVRATDNLGSVSNSTPVALATYAANPAPAVQVVAPNRVYALGETIVVDVVAAAAQGLTVSNVALYADGVLVGTDSTAPYQISWTPSTAGNKVLLARATDSAGETAESDASGVSVFQVPTAQITAPANNAQLAAGSSVTITANASAAPGLSLAEVSFYAGATLLGTDVSSPYAIIWTPPSAGSYALTAVAKDSAGITGTSMAINLVVGAAIAPPTASITAPAANAQLTVNQATTITANAAANGGRTISKVEFFAGATLLGTDTSSPYSFSWTPTSTGTVSLTAKATDSAAAATTSSAVSVTVNAAIAPPTASITAPAANAQLTVNQATTITANAAANGGRTISKVEFFAGATLLGTDTSSPYSFSWTPTSTGTVSLTAKATDSAAAATTSSAVSVTVNAAIAPPTASITAPAANAQLTVNQATTITANAAANGGRTISKVEFFAGATLLGTDTSSPYSFSWTPTSTGTVSLTAKATDSAVAATTSSAVSVTVNAAIAPPTASITAPAANAQLTVNQATTITANAAANGGRTISKVEFFAGATLLGTDTSSPYSLSWTPTSTGTVSLTAKATDSAATATTSSAVSVTVNAAIAPPTASITAPAANAQLTVNQATTITANAAANGGRTISKVEFFAGATLLGTDTSSPYSFSWTPTSTGTVSLTAKATDSAAAATTSSAVSVTVNAAIAPPTASITAPAVNAQLTVNQATTITANAAANGGRTISKVEFFAGATLLGTDTSSPYSFSWTPTSTGTVSLTAKATDSAATATTSSAVSVTVVPVDNTPDAFSFTSVNANANTVTTSASKTLTGFNVGISVSVTGGTYSIDGGAFVSSAGTLNPGSSIRLRVTSGTGSGTVRTVRLTAGGVSGNFNVTTN